MKKTLAVLLMAVLSIAAFAAGSAEASQTGNSLMLGMVTDSGTIDDRSFNQGTFEGVQQAADELGLQCTYLRPSGTTTTDYLTAISDLYDNGYRFIACPGYLFAEAVAQAQEMYPDLMIIIIDDALAAGIGPNTVAITFKEQESGFMAGLATALAILSEYTSTPVREDIAVTGAITMKGIVLPVGGVVTKLQGMFSCGIKDVIIPEANRKEAQEVEKFFKNKMKIHYVSTFEEAVSIIFPAMEKKMSMSR